MRTRPKQPAAIAKLHGNTNKIGKKKLVEDKVVEGIGDLWSPPEWFDDSQRAQWNYALEHAPPGLLTGTDREVLIMWCVASVEYRIAAIHVRVQGQILINENGVVITNPYLRAMEKASMQILRLGSELGFSPSARASLGRAAPEFTPGQLKSTGRIVSGLSGYLDNDPDQEDQTGHANDGAGAGEGVTDIEAEDEDDGEEAGNSDR
jgi:P27 family predicted phage terminase small subunit